MSEYDILDPNSHRARVFAWMSATGGLVAMTLLLVGSCCYYLPVVIAVPLALLSLGAAGAGLTMGSTEADVRAVSILGAVASLIATAFGLLYGCLLCGGFAYIAAILMAMS